MSLVDKYWKKLLPNTQMKTVQVKSATIEELLAYAEEHKYYPSGERLREEIDQNIRMGNNYMHVEFVEHTPCKSGIGCYAEDRSVDVILENFPKEHRRVTLADEDDPVRRKCKIDCWEQVVKMEREAEKREAEFVQTMLANKEKIEKSASWELNNGCRAWCGLESK